MVKKPTQATVPLKTTSLMLLLFISQDTKCPAIFFGILSVGFSSEQNKAFFGPETF